VGSVELVNCVKVNLQANGKLPTLNIERTSGVNAYLQTAESKQVEVVTSSATEINLVLPGATADSDPKELPIPSQFVTKIENDKPVTKPVEHSAN
jgi:adenylyl cyclase-associated protein